MSKYKQKQRNNNLRPNITQGNGTIFTSKYKTKGNETILMSKYIHKAMKQHLCLNIKKRG